MDSSGQYLINSKVLSYATSASVFRFLRMRRPVPPPSKDMSAMGDVPYRDESHMLLASTSWSHRVVRGFADLFGANLDNLPATRDEVLTVSKETGSKSTLLLGDQATEAEFKAQPLDQYKVLHLAVHGVTDSDFPDRAALVLGRDPQSKDDGLLQAREIAELHLNADLVTLSACDTAKGKLQGEAGMESLEEAFFMAGSRAVVASLWSADDATTGSLMQHFYQHLAEGHDKATSLREAKLDLLRKFGGDAAPFYWAGFILTGEGATSIAF
jgi:CHAT domain-containing protein